MKKAASIFLRAEITPQDVQLLIRWMENPDVTRYLNEQTNITHSLRRLLSEVPAPMLTFQFNRAGRFFLVCRPGGDAIGFVKLQPRREPGFVIPYRKPPQNALRRSFDCRFYISCL